MIVQSRNPKIQGSPAGFLKGCVNKKGVAYPGVKVGCFDRSSMMCVSTTTSNKNGDYLIFGSQKKRHFIAALDHTNQFNAVIQDNVVPK